jgi:hypothetical protein
LANDSDFVELNTILGTVRYADRYGYDHNYEIYFKPIPGNKNSTLESTATPEQEAYNEKVRERVIELKEKEWNELMDILRTDLRNFWV